MSLASARSTIGAGIAILVISGAVYLVVSVWIGYPGHIALYETPDARGYSDAAQWLVGVGGSDAALRYRPLLYPLWLGLWQRGGDWSVLFGNLLCWLGMVELATLAAWKLSGRRAAALTLVLVCTNISLIVLGEYALSEPLTILLLAIWLTAVVFLPIKPVSIFGAAALVLPLSLATIVRPSIEVQLVLLVSILVALRPNRAAWVGIGIGLIPVAVQLAFMWIHFRYLGISSIAQINFDAYVAPYVASWTDFPGTLMRNMIAGNLVSTSPFVSIPWKKVTFGMNWGYFIGNMVFGPALAIRLWRRRTLHLAKAILIYAMALIVVGGTVIANGGGDRLVVVALPLWAVALTALLADDARISTRTPPA